MLYFLMKLTILVLLRSEFTPGATVKKYLTVYIYQSLLNIINTL
jgi:hypothetical protein